MTTDARRVSYGRQFPIVHSKTEEPWLGMAQWAK